MGTLWLTNWEPNWALASIAYASVNNSGAAQRVLASLKDLNRAKLTTTSREDSNVKQRYQETTAVCWRDLAKQCVVFAQRCVHAVRAHERQGPRGAGLGW